MLKPKSITLSALVGCVMVLSSAGAAGERQAGTTAKPSPKAGSVTVGTAKGTLTVASSKLQLTHSYVLPRNEKNDPAKTGHQYDVTFSAPLTTGK